MYLKRLAILEKASILKNSSKATFLSRSFPLRKTSIYLEIILKASNSLEKPNITSKKPLISY
jgi:hypothetical protein